MYSAKINNKKIKLNHQQWLRLIRLEWTRIITISSHAAITYWLEPKRSGTGEKNFRWQSVVHRKKTNIILGIIVRIITRLINIYEFESQKHLAFCYDTLTATRVLLSPTRNTCGCCDLAFAKESKVHYLFLVKLRSDECASTDSFPVTFATRSLLGDFHVRTHAAVTWVPKRLLFFNLMCDISQEMF